MCQGCIRIIKHGEGEEGKRGREFVTHDTTARTEDGKRAVIKIGKPVVSVTNRAGTSWFAVVQVAVILDIEFTARHIGQSSQLNEASLTRDDSDARQLICYRLKKEFRPRDASFFTIPVRQLAYCEGSLHPTNPSKHAGIERSFETPPFMVP